MSGDLDHESKALELLDASNGCSEELHRQGIPVAQSQETRALQSSLLANAQVHATLALLEAQQDTTDAINALERSLDRRLLDGLHAIAQAIVMAKS